MKLKKLKSLFRIKKLFIFILLALLGFLPARNYILSRQDTKGETAVVSRGTLEKTISLSGSLDADERVTLQFPTSGKLAWVGAKEGEYVEQYQGIASLDQTTVQKQLERYLNLYMKTRWDFEQTMDNYEGKIITDAIKRILEKSQFDLNNSVLDVEIQNESVRLSSLWTPIEGFVTRVGSPFAGVNITPSQAQFEIVNPNTIYFLATADQTDVTGLKKDMKGILVLDAYPNTPIEGTITTVAFTPKVGETNTVYAIKFMFPNDNSDYRYKVGMTGDVSFVTEKNEDVLYIPSKFVTSDGENKYVTVVKNGKRVKIPVAVGMETEDAIEIESGLSPGDVVYD